MSLARKLPPPWMRGAARPENSISDAPAPPGLARKIRPSGRLGKYFTRPEEQMADEAQSPGLSLTQEIGARQTTGIARRRVQSDLRLPYDMQPMDSSRVMQAGYRDDTQIIRVNFVDGTPWEYYNVPPQVWYQFQKAPSPGRFINNVLNAYPYGRGNF